MNRSTTRRRDDEGKREALRAPSARVSRVERNADGLLVAYVEGRDEPVVGARPTRYFPWSMPDAYLAIRDPDGREVATMESIDELDADSRRIVEQELRDKVFNPKILRVIRYKREFGISSLTAETDRGEVVFQFRDRSDIRLLSPTRALFRDVDGNTYELPDLTQLDAASRRYLHHFF